MYYVPGIFLKILPVLTGKISSTLWGSHTIPTSLTPGKYYFLFHKEIEAQLGLIIYQGLQAYQMTKEKEAKWPQICALNHHALLSLNCSINNCSRSDFITILNLAHITSSCCFMDVSSCLTIYYILEGMDQILYYFIMWLRILYFFR